MKKKIIILVGIIALILLTTNLLSMADLRAQISSSEIDIKERQEVYITLKYNNYNEIKQGINAYKATLEYDKEIFEEVQEEKLVCQNGWENLKYNQATGEFVAIKKVGTNIPEEVVKISLKAKAGVKAGVTEIKIKDIVTSEGEKDISVETTKVSINIIEEQQEKPEEPKTEKILSNKYKILQGEILNIIPNTTVEQFKKNVTLENVTTDPQMVFTDTDGKILQENDIVKTGTKLKVGNTLKYDLIVKGDIDGDGQVSINDVAKLKLHLISIQLLQGIELKAANIDDDKEISINDVAQLKLVLIGLLELK